MKSLSVCLSSTLANNCASLDEISSAVYQISRSLVSFGVSEVIILNDSENAILIASLFQYFITPPYLVHATFQGVELPHNAFAKCKRYPSIPNLPAFQSADFKEAISIDKKPSNWVKSHPEFQAKSSTGRVKPLPKQAKLTKLVQIGREQCLELKEDVELNKRLTVNVKTGEISKPNEAYGTKNVFNVYGYEVRLANKLIDVWTETKVPDGYSSSGFVSGGEFHGIQNSKLLKKSTSGDSVNLLLVCGQWSKFEKLFAGCELEDAQLNDLFDFQLDIPSQMRIEDSVVVALARSTV